MDIAKIMKDMDDIDDIEQKKIKENRSYENIIKILTAENTKCNLIKTDNTGAYIVTVGDAIMTIWHGKLDMIEIGIHKYYAHAIYTPEELKNINTHIGQILEKVLDDYNTKWLKVSCPTKKDKEYSQIPLGIKIYNTKLDKLVLDTIIKKGGKIEKCEIKFLDELSYIEPTHFNMCITRLEESEKIKFKKGYWVAI